MTTEIINELRSAAATLRKPFPAGWTPASDLTAAELLDRAAQEISNLQHDVTSCMSAANAEANEANKASQTLAVLASITPNLFDRVHRSVLTPAQASAKVLRHIATLRREIRPLHGAILAATPQALGGEHGRD